jgi:hypothetical protein
MASGKQANKRIYLRSQLFMEEEIAASNNTPLLPIKGKFAKYFAKIVLSSLNVDLAF